MGMGHVINARSVRSYVEDFGFPCSFSVAHLALHTGLTPEEVEAQSDAMGATRQRCVLCECDGETALTDAPRQRCHVCSRPVGPRLGVYITYRFANPVIETNEEKIMERDFYAELFLATTGEEQYQLVLESEGKVVVRSHDGKGWLSVEGPPETSSEIPMLPGYLEARILRNQVLANLGETHLIDTSPIVQTPSVEEGWKAEWKLLRAAEEQDQAHIRARRERLREVASKAFLESLQKGTWHFDRSYDLLRPADEDAEDALVDLTSNALGLGYHGIFEIVGEDVTLSFRTDDGQLHLRLEVKTAEVPLETATRQVQQLRINADLRPLIIAHYEDAWEWAKNDLRAAQSKAEVLREALLTLVRGEEEEDEDEESDEDYDWETDESIVDSDDLGRKLNDAMNRNRDLRLELAKNVEHHLRISEQNIRLRDLLTEMADHVDKLNEREPKRFRELWDATRTVRDFISEVQEETPDPEAQNEFFGIKDEEVIG